MLGAFVLLAVVTAHPMAAIFCLLSALALLLGANFLSPSPVFPPSGMQQKVIDLGGYDFNIYTGAVGTYPANGFVPAAASFGLRAIIGMAVPLSATGGYYPSLNPTNGKIVMYQSAAAGNPMTEVPNGTNLNAVAITVLAIGIR
jgi:hypothetical protein